MRLRENLEVITAVRKDISVNHLISTASARRLAALGVQDDLEQRAARASRAKFDAGLSAVPDAAPMPRSVSEEVLIR